MNRDNGIVNWCYHLHSTISDIEVDWISVEKKTKHRFVSGSMNIGVMYNIAFKLENTGDEIVVATTRPYSIPGDVAIAFHPDDLRYQHLIGQRAINPLTGKIMPLIADHRVIQELGTGLVKITPACSSFDFQLAQTHKLDIIEIFNSKGELETDCLYKEFEDLNGLNRFELNEKVIEILTCMNQLKSESDHKTRIPICSKSGDLLEYRILPQWFLNVEKANEFIKQKLATEEIKLIPSNHKNTLLDWIQYDKPWCISRQINWGHQMPLYKINLNNGEHKWIAANSIDEAREKYSRKYDNCDQMIVNIEQEKDVLDTWFSSSLVPFAYFGWPVNTEQFNKFYPLSLMETGYDILKFWIHRMLISGYYLTGQLPFHTVLLHGMIVDANGKKMSKSLGNVIDPLDFIRGITLEKLQAKLIKSVEDGYLTEEQLERALKGSKQLFPKGLPVNSVDGLRLCLYEHDPKAEVKRMKIDCIEKNRKLINKIWQSFNFLIFIKGKLEQEQNMDLSTAPQLDCINRDELKEIDRWILSCLSKFVRESKINYENFDLHMVRENFIDFFLHSYCDVYLELIKPSIYNQPNEKVKLMRFSILRNCLATLFSIVHPLMPFITEELYQKLKYLNCKLNRQPYEYESIYKSSYPNSDYYQKFTDSDLEMRMNTLLECTSKMRWIINITQTNKFKKQQLKFKIQSTDDVMLDFLESFFVELKQLGRSENIEIDFNPPFLLDDGMSTEYIVDNSLILKVTDKIQIVVNATDFDLTDMFSKYTNELFEKKSSSRLKTS